MSKFILQDNVQSSGYTEDSARHHASKLLNGKDFPLVTEYIKNFEMKENEDME